MLVLTNGEAPFRPLLSVLDVNVFPPPTVQDMLLRQHLRDVSLIP